MKKKGITTRNISIGRKFVLHWEIGVLFFWLIPLCQSVKYSFSTVKILAGGVDTNFVGMKYFKYLFTEDPQYLSNIKSSLSTLAYSLPLIVALSLILAIVLNQRFFGRTLMRGIFFLPVILTSGVLLEIMSKQEMGMMIFNTSKSAGAATAVYRSAIDFEQILSGLNLPDQVNTLFSTYIGNVLNLLWSCGVPIILFLAGLQSIPDQLYEVSKVEGANSWENFWYITFPMLGDVTFLVLFYVAIDHLISVSNPVISQAYAVLRQQQIYDRSSAMLWTYFVVIGFCLGLLFFIYNRVCLRRWNG